MAGTPARNGNNEAGNSDFSRKAMELAAQWSTPRATDGEKGGPNQSFGAGGTPLPAQAAQWPTPATRDFHAQGATHNPAAQSSSLATIVEKQWPTPSAGNFNDGESLESFDARKARQKAKGINGNGMGDSLAIAASRAVEISQPSPPDPQTPAGPASSPERRSLNPLFVEWLMGWPTGLSGFERAETEFSRWQQQTRGYLWTLPSRRPVRQTSFL
jgi:hypothetical protein